MFWLWFLLFTFYVNSFFPLNIQSLLIGTSEGLYVLENENFVKLDLLNSRSVEFIHRNESGYYFISEGEIAFSADLFNLEWRENGIETFKSIEYSCGTFEFTEKFEPMLKLKSYKKKPSNLIAYNKNSIYFSTNGGLRWYRLKIPLNEITAACISSAKDGIKLYISHPYNGVYQKDLGKKNNFVNISKGLVRKFNFFYDDISDINTDEDGNLYISMSFENKLYSYDFSKKTWLEKFTIPGNFEALYQFEIVNKNEFILLTDEEIHTFQQTTNNTETDINIPESKNYFSENEHQKTAFESKTILTYLTNFYFTYQTVPKCILINNAISLDNLEVLFFRYDTDEYKRKCASKKGIYISPYVLMKRKGKLSSFFPLLKEKNLNSIVIDMKDDFGYLHFIPENSEVRKICKVKNPINLEQVVEEARKNGIYLIARIVVFKDKVLYHYNNNELALKDIKTGLPWMGVKLTTNNGEVFSEETKEYWVDPYNTNVWKYVVEIAKELVERGFDEIQFDYIRFPTDGTNLSNIRYPSAVKGMSKENVIFSFLKYARKEINAPISIDIYGNNGWYRSGGITGQDVEKLSFYVDAICPMFYPSHFSQDFLNFEPYEERPYRIYYFGGLRTYHFSKKRVVVRPYVQHFKLNVSYDNLYYGNDYIQNEILGIEDGVNMGYILWNMEGKY